MLTMFAILYLYLLTRHTFRPKVGIMLLGISLLLANLSTAVLFLWLVLATIYRKNIMAHISKRAFLSITSCALLLLLLQAFHKTLFFLLLYYDVSAHFLPEPIYNFYYDNIAMSINYELRRSQEVAKLPDTIAGGWERLENLLSRANVFKILHTASTQKKAAYATLICLAMLATLYALFKRKKDRYFFLLIWPLILTEGLGFTSIFFVLSLFYICHFESVMRLNKYRVQEKLLIAPLQLIQKGVWRRKPT